MGTHHSRVNRETGELTLAGVTRSGTSPSCLIVNKAGTIHYSANETDRLHGTKEGTDCAYSIHAVDGQLEVLNTVASGGAGSTNVSLHPSGRYLLVANYFG